MSLLWGVRRVKASVTSLRRCLSTVDRGTFAGLPGLVSPSDWQKLGRDAESKYDSIPCIGRTAIYHLIDLDLKNLFQIENHHILQMP